MEQKIRGRNVCVHCGRQTNAKRDGIWQCFSCFHGYTDIVRKLSGDGHGGTHHEKRGKSLTGSDKMVDDAGPIEGIGDSLKALEVKLKAIDVERDLKVALIDYQEHIAKGVQ